MAKIGPSNLPQMRGASYNPSVFRRLWVGSFHSLRRRFVKITLILLLTVVVLVLGVLGYFFRPAKVNQLINEGIASAFEDPELVSYDEAETLVDFPALNGQGAVRLFNLKVRSPSKQYDVLEIPEVVVYYDLFGLPDSALSRVVVPQGLTAIVNSSEDGEFIDANILKQSESSGGTTILLPEFELNNARVLFRFPQALAEPVGRFAGSEENRFTYNGQQGYFLSNISVRGQLNPDNPSQLLVQGETNCEAWKEISFNGSVARDPSRFALDLQAQRKGLILDHELSNCFRPGVLKIWEMFWAKPERQNVLDVSASVQIKDGETALAIDGYFSGSIMYRNIPIRATDVRGSVHFDGKNLTIKDAVGRRGNATVRLNGWLNGVGTPSESLAINVEIEGIYANQTVFDALRGMPDGKGGYVFPEWEAYGRPDAITSPNRMPIFAQLYDQFQPNGLCNVRVEVHSGGKLPQDEINLEVDVIDVTSQVWGNRLGLTETLLSPRSDEEPAFGSLARLQKPLPEAVESALHNAPGFPLTVYNAQGKVTGKIRHAKPDVFTVRGFNRQDAERIADQIGSSHIEESTKGMIAWRANGRDKIYAEVTITEEKGRGKIDNSSVEVVVRSDPMVIDDELLSAIPEGVQETIRLFSPQGGRVKAERVTISDSANEDIPTGIILRLSLEDLDGSYQIEKGRTPLALKDLKADVHFDSRTGRARITQGSATLLGIPVKLSKFVVSERRPVSGIEVEANVEEFELSPRFFDYLPASAADVREFFTVDTPTGPAFGLEGRARAHVRAIIGPDLEDPDALEEIVVQISLDAKRVGMSALSPFDLKEVKGEIILAIRDDGIQIDLMNIRGTAGDEVLPEDQRSKIAISGGIYLPSSANPGHWDFNVEGERVLLSKALQSAVNKVMGGSDKEGSGIVSLWRDLEPASGAIGRVSIDGKLSGVFDTPNSTEYAFDIGLEDGAITYKGFALPLTGVRGDLLVTNNGVSFSGFSANLPHSESTTIEVPLLEQRDDGSFVIAITAKNLPLDEPFRESLPKSIRSLYDQMRPESLAERMAKKRKDDKQLEDPNHLSNAISGEVTLTIQDKRFDYSARIALHDVDIEMGVVFEKCRGSIQHRASFVTKLDPSGKEISVPTLKGTMALERAEWRSIEFEDVTTLFQLRDGRVAMPDIRGKLYDGNLRASIEIDTNQEDTSYSGRVRATRVMLGPLTEAVFGKASVDSTGKEAMKGGVDAELTFASARENGYIGQGRIDVGRVPVSEEVLLEAEAKGLPVPEGERGSFGRVPLFAGLYQSLSLDAGENFDEAHMMFNLYDRYLELRGLELISDGLAVKTQDDNFILFEPDKDGNQFDLTLVPILFPRAPSVPGANLVFDAIRGLVLRVYVTGPLDAPQVQALAKRQNKTEIEEEQERHASPFEGERERKDPPDRVRPDYSPLGD